MIGLVGASVLGIVLITYIFLRKVVPMVSRMKNRMMVEEEVVGSQGASKGSKGTLDDQPIQSN